MQSADILGPEAGDCKKFLLTCKLYMKDNVAGI